MILANVPAFYYGTSPNKFFDYLASGLPVVNNYPGWLSEMITTHQCGVAVAPDDPEAFADAMEHLADNPEVREEMRRNARALAEAEFAIVDSYQLKIRADQVLIGGNQVKPFEVGCLDGIPGGHVSKENLIEARPVRILGNA